MAAADMGRQFQSAKYPGLASEHFVDLADAEDRIEFASRTESRVLNLSGLRLTSLPDAIGGLVELNYLDCSLNSLTTLPDSICTTTLEVLICRHNPLNALPENLGKCDGLKKLDCSYDTLAWLPDNIGTALEALKCCGNRLTYLPDSISTDLKKLDCSTNRLTALPDCISTALEKLDCSGNSLTTLPESLPVTISQADFDCRFNEWDPAWISAQGLSPGDDPTIESLRAWAAKQAAGRVKPARA